MNTNKNTFSGNVAYTTPSGRMHLGHGLGQVTTDVAIRFSALKEGKKPFFPFAMHSTGKDLVKIIKQLEGNEDLSPVLVRYNISIPELSKILSYPDLDSRVNELVDIYRGQYEEVLKSLGTCIDFTTFFSSHQAENQRFTQWTLKKLDEKGLIVQTSSQRPYCDDCGEIKAIERDLSEVSAKGKVDWEVQRIQDGKIAGGEFYCRLHSNTPITVKTTSERAIDYSNSQVQDKVIELSAGMKIFPQKHASDLEEIIRTRKAKPFERRPYEMVGAISPFDDTKKVEALADSNIYMEFFPVAQMVKEGKLKLQNLSDQLFDFVYLGRGNVDEAAKASGLRNETIQELSQRVSQIYPMDLSVIGFEHKEVHMPFSLFTRAAILPDSFFFKEYLITGHITNSGEKMSKSKGNVVYLDETLKDIAESHPIEGLSKESSLDSLRFFLAYYQYLDKDFDWNQTQFISAGVGGVRRFVKGIEDASRLILLNIQTPSLGTRKDKWLSTIAQRSIEESSRYMEERNHRDSLILSVDMMGKSLREYVHSKGEDNGLVSNFVSAQLALTHPVMPRVTQELSHRIFGNREISWPSYNPNLVFPEEFEEEEHIRNGNEYVKRNIKIISAEVEKLIGKKYVSPKGQVEVSVPAQYLKNLLSKQDFKLPGDCRITYTVDNSSKLSVRPIN